MPRPCPWPIAATLFSVVALAGLASSVGAQPGDQPPPADPPLLRGPTVQDTSIPGTARAFTMSADMGGPQARLLNREVPMGEFLGAIRALGAPETPEELRLSDDQRQAFQAIVRDFAQAQRLHMQAHREELIALGQTLGFDPAEMGRAEQMFVQRLDQGQRRARRTLDTPPPSADDGGPRQAMNAVPADGPRPGRSPEQIIRERVGQNPTPEQRAAIDRLREIRDSGPSALEAQTLAWNTLTAPQQQFVQARLEEARARVDAQRGEMYVQEMSRQIEGRLVQRPALPTLGDAAAPGSAGERLHRLIDTLTPQEQEALLRLLEMRLRDRLGGDGAGVPGRPAPFRPGLGAPGSRRQPPPPTMDEVQVPAPGPTDPV